MKTCHFFAVPIVMTFVALAGDSAAQSSDVAGPSVADQTSAGGRAFGEATTPNAPTASTSVLPDLPLTFLENHGQWDSPARFAAHKGPVTIAVEPHALTVTVARENEISTTGLRFEGASDAVTLEPFDPLAGAVNIYRGDDPERWAEGLVRYERLAYRGLYDGVDVLLRSAGGQLEYDVLLAPGADLRQFAVVCEGVQSISLDAEGGLLLHTVSGVLRQSAPITWAEQPDGTRDPIECRFLLLGETRYGFELLDAPKDRAVVIDPGLEWSTYLGGNGDDDLGSVAVDSAGRLVVTGLTGSTGWMLPGGTVNTNGSYDGFVAVLDPDLPAAQQVVWWTYFGGTGEDIVWDVELNSAGDVFFCGGTRSLDLPITAGAYDSTRDGAIDGFVGRLAAGTGSLLYLSYVGGGSLDLAHRLLLEEPATVTLGGATQSLDLPVTANAHDSTRGGSRDYFISVLDLDQSGAAGLQYMSYFGGSQIDGWITERQMDIAFAPGGELILAGSAQSSDLPLGAPSFEMTNTGGQDAFISLLDLTVAGPSAVTYTAYIGSNAGDGVSNVEVDPTGGIVVSGFSYSGLFPTTPDAAFPTFEGPASFNDGWIVKIDPALPPSQQFVYSTYVPGSGYEGFFEMVVDAAGTVYAAGFSGRQSLMTNNLPVTCGAFDTIFDGPGEGILLALTPAGNGLDDLHYLTYFGGAEALQGEGLGGLLLAPTTGTPIVLGVGGSRAADVPTTPGAFQTAIGGQFDGFAYRLRLNPFLTCVAGANSVSPDGARICARGSFTLASNALDLAIEDLPLGSVGYFLMSTTDVPSFTLPPPSGGSLCLGGTIVRFAGFVQSSGSSGTVAFRPDLANIPPPGAPLVPGDTVHFQYWYRDVGSTSNTSNGVSVTLD